MNNLHFIVAGLLAGALTLPPSAAVADQKEHPGKDTQVNLHIPPGHLPTPGQCRIWYPNRPPSHQPAPGSCRVLSRRVPQDAWLVGHDGMWKYNNRFGYEYYRYPAHYGKPDSRQDNHYPRGVDEGRSHSSKSEIRGDIRDISEARKDLGQHREQLEKNRAELDKDRVELRRDVRNGASGQEIRQDRREIHQDVQKVADSKKDVRQSQNRLEAAHRELKEDLRNR